MKISVNLIMLICWVFLLILSGVQALAGEEPTWLMVFCPLLIVIEDLLFKVLDENNKKRVD